MTVEEDSNDTWKYVIVLSKFMLHFLESSVSKSFGVLIPAMVVLFDTNLSLLGLVCSFPVTWMLIACPVAAYVLKYGRVNQRFFALFGALMVPSCVIGSGFTRSVPALGIYLALFGMGSAMTYMPSLLLLNDYFPRRFVLMSALTQLGSTVGILFVPILIERCNRAYGYTGAMLILGGILMHSIAASATLRAPKSMTSTRADPTKADEEEQKIPICAQVQNGAISNRSKEEMVTASMVHRQNTSNNNIREHIQGNTDRVAAHNSTRIDLVLREGTDDNDISLNKLERDPRLTDVKKMKGRVLQWLLGCFFIKQPLFTLTLPANFLIQYVTYAWMLLLVPRAEWLGIESKLAVLLSTLGGIGALVGRLILMVALYYEVDSFQICCVNSAVAAVTFFVDAWVGSFPVMCVTAFIQGWVLFTNTALRAAFCKMTTSTEYFGLACGYSALIGGLGGNSGGLLSGMLFDATHSFRAVFMLLGGLHCVIIINVLIYMGVLRYMK